VDNVSGNTDDKPWRMSKMVDKTMVQWDRRWHHVHIPFSQMKESGAWYNETWYNPEGRFEWSAIDRFQISIEQTGTFMQKIWFDNITITNLDTAVVRENLELGINDKNVSGASQITAWPNPARNTLTVTYNLTDECKVTLSVISLSGKKIRVLKNELQSPGLQLVTWDMKDDNGTEVNPGFYIIVIKIPLSYATCKILKL
jgi:endoglucanase